MFGSRAAGAGDAAGERIPAGGWRFRGSDKRSWTEETLASGRTVGLYVMEARCLAMLRELLDDTSMWV